MMKTLFGIAAILLFLASPMALASAHEIDVGVNGMVCAFCAQGITKKFSKEPAVEKVKVSLEDKLVALRLKDGKDISNERITTILKDAGYSVSKIERK